MTFNKYFFYFLLIPLVFLPACGSKSKKQTAAWNTPEELVALMTLDEKIGQMTQAERGQVRKGDIEKYALGSVLSGGGSWPPGNSPESWVAMINDFTEESSKTRLGIPVIYGLDAVHGHNNVLNTTILPHNVGLGAIAAGSRERGIQAAYLAGSVTAKEMLATGVCWSFAPVLGVPEDVRWGRTYECYSENVEIVALMGSNVVRGLQDNGAAACIKHFLGEGQTIDGQNQGNALLDRAGIERILPPYRAAIDAGAMSLMASFSSVNGIKMHENKELLTDLLKEELGFKGFVISDWEAVNQVSGGSYKEKIANSINAGIDMVMAAGGRSSWIGFINYMHELVEEGTVPMSRIDDAVLRIIRFKQSIGLFDAPLKKKPGITGTEANRNIARNLVSSSLVLLRNEDNAVEKLPESKRILVAGIGADDIGMQCGGWSITWQGSHGQITKGTTILEGIKSAVKDETEIVYDKYGKAQGDFDAVIAVIGEDPYAETYGDRNMQSQNLIRMIDLNKGTTGSMKADTNEINICAEDLDMLWEAYGYDCPVIVIMLSGRPMTIGDEYLNWDAFIAAWLPGTEGGGIADVLFGGLDFQGKTPYTWRKTIDGEIIYPFGYGLTKS